MKQVGKAYKLFFKFGEESHLLKMMNSGMLRCNTLKYFRELNTKKQGDKNEGIIYSTPIEINSIKIGDNEYSFEKNQVPGIFQEHDYQLKKNLFCFYGAEDTSIQKLYRKEISNLINRSEFDFGKYFVIIHNPKEFVERISGSINSLELDFKFGPIKYVDLNKHDGVLDVFYKCDTFKDQNELRFVIDSKSDDPLDLYIGDINDIALGPFPIDELDKLKLIFS